MGDKRAYFKKRIVSIYESHGRTMLKLENNHTWRRGGELTIG